MNYLRQIRGVEMKKYQEDEEKYKKEVLKELSDWIIKELKNTSSITTESILPKIIESYLNYFSED